MKLSRGWLWVLSLLALVSIGSLQAVWDTAAAPYKTERKKAALLLAEPALPTVTNLKFLSLNQRGALADLLWLKSIQYFGQGNPYGKYPSLGKIMDTVTRLDPKFAYPYAFSLVVLPYMDQTPIAIEIGERAQTALPGDGLLTFYLASAYHLNVKDYARAGALYEKASREKGAPPASKELAGVALSSANTSSADRLAALAFWKTVFDNANDDSERDRAAKWYGHMQVVYALEQAAEQYKKEQGSYPENLEVLRDKGYIPSIPDSPINRLLVLNPETGRIDFSQSKY